MQFFIVPILFFCHSIPKRGWKILCRAEDQREKTHIVS